jgi:Protein of unknown function (DUF3987)
MSNYNSEPPPWEEKKPLIDPFGAVDINQLHAFRRSIDDQLAKRLDASVSEPRPLPKLNKRVCCEFPAHALGAELARVTNSIARKDQCHIDIAAHVVESYLSLAQQPHVNVRLPWNRRVTPVSLFLLTVADPSEGKTSADEEIAPTIRRRERELYKTYEKDREIYAIAMEQWSKNRLEVMKSDVSASPVEKAKLIGDRPRKPLPPILVAQDPTVEGLRDQFLDGAPSLGLFSDDGGTFLGGYSLKAEQATNTISTLSQMWNAKELTKMKAKSQDGHGGASRLEKYRLSVHLMIQPELANKFLNNPLFAGQGLLSRFLVAWPDTSQMASERRSKSPDPEDERIIDAFNQRLYSILTAPVPTNGGEWQPKTMDFSAEAAKLFAERYDDNQTHLGLDGKYTPAKGFVGKSLEQGARIAANLQAFYEPSANYIHPDIASMSLEIMDYYIEQQLSNEDAINDPAIVKAHKLYNFLNDESKCELEYVNTSYLLTKGPYEFRSSEKLTPVIKTLEEYGLLQDAGKGHVIDGYGVARKAYKVNRGF